ncbi:lasso peptide biosynthesis PqqD family chaperone [Streptomyces sp. MST-110588]|uniref:lasso peptide biosynthesis PqqD family chaperone n=1 Tax=Streptomyces sp. MST-110588 TaxID=2833628 RepID=UPI001F5CA317|nr:lasso peptide biosynthesis PqqD family chaperone [Streptomyces sp. MST-110588]UNO43086.1 lasso peptide biosynthesis PqqD family chaperone [Streptomyces sp. MST-110588]
MTLTLPSHVSATDVEDELVLLNERDGRYWHLNRTGAKILRLLLAGHSPEESARLLTRDCPDAAERALADVRALLESLRASRLVKPS